MNERIGELLVKENLLSSDQLLKAREEAATKGKRLGAQITALGFLDENELTEFVAKQYGVPSINLEDFTIEPEVLSLIPEDVANKHNVAPRNGGVSANLIRFCERAYPCRDRSKTKPSLSVSNSSICKLATANCTRSIFDMARVLRKSGSDKI